MTAANHAVTGAVIGLTIANPVLAITLALLSHFVLDAIPHYDSKNRVTTKAFDIYLATDAILCVLLVIALFVNSPDNWLVPSICAFLAVSPDFMWAKGYFRSKSSGKFTKPKYLLARLHSSIQWFQRPIGWIVEFCWLMAGIFILAKII